MRKRLLKAQSENFKTLEQQELIKVARERHDREEHLVKHYLPSVDLNRIAKRVERTQEMLKEQR